MGTLTINGRKITVDDSFARLSPQEQEKTVSEIAAQMGTAPEQAGPQGAPGSRAYADWAAKQAMAGRELPQIEGSAIPTNEQSYNNALEGYRRINFPQFSHDEFQARTKERGALQPLNPQEIVQNDQMFGFGDELTGVAGGLANVLQGRDFGSSYDAASKLQEARRNLGIEQNGPIGQGASVLGQLTSFGAAAPGAAVQTASRIPQVVKDIGSSSLTGAVMGGVQGFGTAEGDAGQRLEGAKRGAIAGGAVGAIAPVAIRAVAAPFQRAAQNSAINSAIKNAPSADELSDAASAMFKSSKSSGVGVKPQVFGTFARDLARKAHAADIDKDLDSAAYTVYDRMIQLAQDGFADPSALSLSRLHNLRQKATDIAYDINAKGRTRKFAGDMVDELDNLVGSLKPGDLTGPSNLIGNGKSATNSLLDGISTWSRAKKVGLLETAIKSAQNYPSGVESGLRNQFRTLLNGKKTRFLFSPEERKAMQAVVNGSAPIAALRTLGMFRGLSGVLLGSAFGGPGGAVVGGLAGAAGRKVTEKAAEAAAERAAKIVATPNIPTRSAYRIRVPGTTLPLLPNRNQ